MNLLTKFHEDRTVNVASRKKCPAPWKPFFQANIIIFELIQDIIETNLLTKFHEDWTINMASRVLTRKNAPPQVAIVLTRKIAPPLWWPYIIEMNLLTEFHEDRTINVASRVLTRFYSYITIFELIQDIIETNLLTKFHEDWTINVASRELTRQMLTPHNAQRTKIDHKSSP
ncbi:hypothetical protein DPMN_071993 [Dreissena polymorpha]|uniref:Uncharacterized protein n=1 Tax=Dreissena polymorpha TaxID=45954 RepID=A0A9D3Z5I6_DREPO|nr:hypothetical protein DPMN_071993 [Dreissena polymorpha]